jgi:hypothetical protein
MNTIFETLFFLAVGLIAITITVFVLAVSLLGRAIKISLEEQEKAENERKESNNKEKEKIEITLNIAKKENSQVDRERLEQIIRNFSKKDKKHDRTLKWIKWKPNLLKANWGVFIPSLFFIVAIGISAFARFQLNQLNTDFQWLYFGLSLLALAFGTVFICLTLNVIESVAITSEETALIRQKDMYKAAIKEIEEEKKPELELSYGDEKPPFHFDIGQVKTVCVGIELKHGEAARNPKIGLIAPKSFSFPNMDTTIQSKYTDHPDHIATFVYCNNCIIGFVEQHNFVIKAPDIKGTYKLYWNIYCENIPEKELEFEIIVE